MKFFNEHLDECILFLALLGFAALYAYKPGPDAKGWVDNLIGAMILALTGGGVKAAINFKNGNDKPPE